MAPARPMATPMAIMRARGQSIRCQCFMRWEMCGWGLFQGRHQRHIKSVWLYLWGGAIRRPLKSQENRPKSLNGGCRRSSNHFQASSSYPPSMTHTSRKALRYTESILETPIFTPKFGPQRLQGLANSSERTISLARVFKETYRAAKILLPRGVPISNLASYLCHHRPPQVGEKQQRGVVSHASNM